MSDYEKKDDNQSWHEEWCEDWDETWYEEDSYDKKQAHESRSTKGQTHVHESLVGTKLEDFPNDDKFNKVSEPKISESKVKATSDHDNQVKSETDFFDYIDELESAPISQVPSEESNHVHYVDSNTSVDVVISMD